MTTSPSENTTSRLPHWSKPFCQHRTRHSIEVHDGLETSLGKGTVLDDQCPFRTVAESRYFAPIWPHRCVVPANGWYEWTGEPGKKQPYYIHLKTEEPMFFAAIGEFSGHVEHDGFVVITPDSQGGMVDIHDRRPVVLPPALAREWLDSSPHLNGPVKSWKKHHSNQDTLPGTRLTERSAMPATRVDG